MMVRFLDLNIVVSDKPNGQLLTNGTFLMDTSTISTQHQWPSQHQMAKKVTTNVAIATTNKALTYRGVTFNFDAKGIDAAKEKAIHFDQLQTDRNGTSYLYENGQKVTGLKTFDGVTYYFYEDGRQAKGTEVTINGKTYQFDQLTGIMTRNAFSKSYNYEGSPRFPYYPTR